VQFQAEYPSCAHHYCNVHDLPILRRCPSFPGRSHCETPRARRPPPQRRRTKLAKAFARIFEKRLTMLSNIFHGQCGEDARLNASNASGVVQKSLSEKGQGARSEPLSGPTWGFPHGCTVDGVEISCVCHRRWTLSSCIDGIVWTPTEISAASQVS
jgi:hypothetical protein